MVKLTFPESLGHSELSKTHTASYLCSLPWAGEIDDRLEVPG